MSKNRPVLGWWFAAKDSDGVVRLPRGDGRKVKVGGTLTVSPPIRLCEWGLHASQRALDALYYAPGETVCRVRLSGEIVEGDDKSAATERTVLWMVDAGRTLHEFAVWSARQALLAERKRGREPDPRTFAALKVKERWLNGLATLEELSAASTAAWVATASAERAASTAASMEWAERSAAWASEGSAVPAAGCASRSAAWASEAESAASTAQNRKLESMLHALARDDR